MPQQTEGISPVRPADFLPKPESPDDVLELLKATASCMPLGTSYFQLFSRHVEAVAENIRSAGFCALPP
jgi:hypothetical protein